MLFNKIHIFLCKHFLDAIQFTGACNRYNDMLTRAKKRSEAFYGCCQLMLCATPKYINDIFFHIIILFYMHASVGAIDILISCVTSLNLLRKIQYIGNKKFFIEFLLKTLYFALFSFFLFPPSIELVLGIARIDIAAADVG
jgi:hypothetical protein